MKNARSTEVKPSALDALLSALIIPASSSTQQAIVSEVRSYD